MTGYTVHTGSSEKFSDGWDNIFSKNSAKKAKKKTNAKKKSGKKPSSSKKKK